MKLFINKAVWAVAMLGLGDRGQIGWARHEDIQMIDEVSAREYVDVRPGELVELIKNGEYARFLERGKKLAAGLREHGDVADREWEYEMKRELYAVLLLIAENEREKADVFQIALRIIVNLTSLNDKFYAYEAVRLFGGHCLLDLLGDRRPEIVDIVSALLNNVLTDAEEFRREFLANDGILYVIDVVKKCENARSLSSLVSILEIALYFGVLEARAALLNDITECTDVFLKMGLVVEAARLIHLVQSKHRSELQQFSRLKLLLVCSDDQRAVKAVLQMYRVAIRDDGDLMENSLIPFDTIIQMSRMAETPDIAVEAWWVLTAAVRKRPSWAENLIRAEAVEGIFSQIATWPYSVKCAVVEFCITFVMAATYCEKLCEFVDKNNLIELIFDNLDDDDQYELGDFKNMVDRLCLMPPTKPLWDRCVALFSQFRESEDEWRTNLRTILQNIPVHILIGHDHVANT